MAVYFNRELKFPNSSAQTAQGKEKVLYHLTEWHCRFSILAVSSRNELRGGSVNFFEDEVGFLQF